MGKYAKRTDYINRQLLRTDLDPEQRRLLSNGFMTDEVRSDFEQSQDISQEDRPLHEFSDQNYFYYHPEKIAGTQRPGTGFLNPLLVDGNVEDAVKMLNHHLREETAPDQKHGDDKKSPPVTDTHTPNSSAKMRKVDNEKVEILNPEIVIEKGDADKIRNKGLLKVQQPESEGKVLSVEDTISIYNPGISDDEIRAWVYHKRKYGNPMKGWEKYFLRGNEKQENLITTIRETTIKDNKYQDLRVIPANTVIGIKTRFRNSYGTDTLMICRTPQGELVWVNVNDVRENKSSGGASQKELDQLVVAGALVFTGDDYFPYPVYYFGNIYEKIETLNQNREQIVAKYGQDVYDFQVKKLEELKPKLKTFRDPVKNNRPSILCLSAFANDPVEFGVSELSEEANVKLGTYRRNRFVEVSDKISLFDAFSQWMESTVKDSDLKNTTKSNIKTYYFAKAIRWPKNEDGSDVYSSAQKDELVGNARIAAEELFSEFLATALTYEDGVALDAIWNRKYNAFTSVIQFVDKVPIGFRGNSMFKRGKLGIKPAQRQGLAYLQLTGSGCIAYDVGFGKTLTGILNMAQLLAQGAISRPLIVVPKPTYKNWLKELIGYWTDGERTDFEQFEGAVFHYGVLSGTGVKVNDWFNLSGNHYKKLLLDNKGDLNKLVPENSITIVSYKGYEQMGLSRDVSDVMFESISRVILQKEAMADDAKETAKTNERIMETMGRGNKNSVVDLDKCGFDFLCVDEAHNFKNVFGSCGKDPDTGRKLFGISAGVSTRAIKNFFFTNYIQSRHGKKVVLLTATPFTNSPLEIYSMLSFIGLDTLKEYNLYNIKKFFEQFVLQTIEYAIDAKGEIITKPVIKSFKNLKLLQTVLYNHFHYKDDPKEANVIRPCLINLPNRDITTYLEMNDWQKNNQQIVKSIAKSVSRTNPGAMLKAINQSLDNAFSPYLFSNEMPESAEDFVDQSPKIQYAMECVRSVRDWHESRGEECSGIVLYSNRGKQYFDFIKDYLIDNVGFKRVVTYDDEQLSEVEIITGGGGEADEDRKELVKDAFNAGIVKVIIGTSTIREGVNLQTRGTALIDLYPEWNPTDIVQLKGRIWRQGNIFGYVRFVMPLVINSMDNFINQKQDEKSKRITGLWSPIGDSNVLENTSDLDPAEIKYELVDDAMEKFKMKYDQIKQEMQRDFSILNENKNMMKEAAGSINDLKDAEEALFEDLREEREKRWKKYLNVLQKVNLKEYKEEGRTRTVQDVEKVIENLNDLLSALSAYEANRYQIADLIAVGRMIRQRKYDVFTDASTLGKNLEYAIDTALDGQTWKPVRMVDWKYNDLVSAYSSIRKVERSVLAPYGKTWTDDISTISEDINNRIEEMKQRAETVESKEYQESLMQEIEAEMEAKRSVRGDLNDQVERFRSLNHLLSYLSDNTDKENCPIPMMPCCETNGINIVEKDTQMPDRPVEIIGNVDTVQEPAPAPPVMTMAIAKTRVKLIDRMLAKDPGSQTLKTRKKLIMRWLEKMESIGSQPSPPPVANEPIPEPEPAWRPGQDQRKTNKRDEEIAQTILMQLGGAGRLKAMLGANSFVIQPNGVSFRIKAGAGKPNFVHITLNGLDYYNVRIGIIAGDKFKLVYDTGEDGMIDFEQLPEVIEEQTGMYLRLAQGGELAANEYVYVINLDERGRFYADVRNTKDETIYEIQSNDDDGSISEIEDGFMRHTQDVSGLEQYLKYLGIINQDATVTMEYAEGGGIAKTGMDIIVVEKGNGSIYCDRSMMEHNDYMNIVQVFPEKHDTGKTYKGIPLTRVRIYNIITAEHERLVDELVAEYEGSDSIGKSKIYKIVEDGAIKFIGSESEVVNWVDTLVHYDKEEGESINNLADAELAAQGRGMQIVKAGIGEMIEDAENSQPFGSGGRLKSALMRDRKYRSNQDHELAYNRKTAPKNPRYKMASGGRLKSALMRDRAYKSNEPHELRYHRIHKPRNPRYKKMGIGGGISRSDSHQKFSQGGSAAQQMQIEQLANLAYQLQNADGGWIDQNPDKFLKMQNEFKELYEKVNGKGSYNDAAIKTEYPQKGTHGLPVQNSLSNMLVNYVSTGYIASKMYDFGYTNLLYSEVAKVRGKMWEILNSEGDKEYSLTNLNNLIEKAANDVLGSVESYKKNEGKEFKKGGEIDLFQTPDKIPAKVQAVLDKYIADGDDFDYDNLKKAQQELNRIGYTFDYDLDGIAYDLRPMKKTK